MFYLALLLFVAVAVYSQTFTGDVEKDFNGPAVIIVPDPGDLDVGLPPGFAALGLSVSGWDIKDIRFRYDTVTQELQVGINCFGVCGDADGSGEPGVPHPALVARGGTDQADFGGSETALVAFDFGVVGTGGAPDGQMDFVIGYPSAVGAGSDPFPCGKNLDTRCFGLYNYAGTGLDVPNNRFSYSTVGGILPHPTRDNNPTTSLARPDLEWTINQFAMLRSKAGFAPIDTKVGWKFNALAFMGSFQDDGIGEDFFPTGNDFVTVVFPCTAFDACDVCGGDSSSCLDCAGRPNGPNRYDTCDVCGGDGTTCRDCAGTPNGPARYDRCDVCAGDDTRCVDCRGIVAGSSRYDRCDVCGGDDSSCRDCRGTLYGTSKYDACDVCAGNGASCRDCSGMPNGPKRYDQCDVCGGENDTCLDCKGVPNGPAKYDVCDVCGGDGSSCVEKCDQCAEPREASNCALYPGDVYRGQFARYNDSSLSLQQFTVTVATLDYVIITTDDATIFGRWALKSNATMAIQHLASSPAEHFEACGNKVATYLARFNENCTAFSLTVDGVFGEPCDARRNLLGYSIERIKHWATFLVRNASVTAEPIVLTRQPCVALPASGVASCKLPDGAGIVHGQYVSLKENHAEGNGLASFDITFAPNGAFVEASKVAVYFNAAQKAAWGVDPSVINYGALFSEVGAQEEKFACPYKNATQYDVVPASAKDANCTTSFQFTTSADECIDRFARLDRVALRRQDVCAAQAARDALHAKGTTRCTSTTRGHHTLPPAIAETWPEDSSSSSSSSSSSRRSSSSSSSSSSSI